MVNTQFNTFWPWLRRDSDEDLQGRDATYPVLAGTSLGLSNWQPANSFLRPAWLEREVTSPSFRIDPDVADSTVASPSHGLWNWRPPENAQQPVAGSADPSQGLSNWRPPSSALQPPIGFRMRPDTELRPDSQSWWSEINTPWLGADSGGEASSFDPPREAETSQSNPAASASAPRTDLVNAASGDLPPLNASPVSVGELHPATTGVVAGTASAATAGGALGSQVIGEAASKIAEIAGRVAPIAGGATSVAAWALPSLVIPTNTQSRTIDLQDGVRARIRPGQRTIEIERRVGSGLFGTGLGASWVRLPVNAEIGVGKDGAETWTIDHDQLRQALLPAESSDASTSEMARPTDKRKDGTSSPPAGIGHNSGEVLDPGNGREPDPKKDKPPAPNNGGGPSIWDHVLASTFEILRTGKQSKSVDEERIDTCRKVMKSVGEPAPDGQYRGPDGRDTKAGVRLGPDMRDPTSGLDHYPEHQHLRDGVKGEQELANRIKQLNPKEKIIHFSPAAGVQGPDIMSISERGEVAFWDSKYRNRQQSIPPSQRANATDRSLGNLSRAEEHIQNAVADGSLSKELAAKALSNLITGNFLLCTVGMGQAHRGVVEIVKDGKRTGPL